MKQNISVAIVGRPNVGKSRLFNRLAGKRISIVHDRPGVTRDAVVADSPHGYVLMDTGGIGMLPEMTPAEIQNATESQADFAIRAASLFFLLSMAEKVYSIWTRLLQEIQEDGQKPLLVVNKIDEPEKGYSISEFAKLGFDEVIGVSAEHGHGITDLLVGIEKYLPEIESAPEIDQVDRPKIAFIGRPNVGKSSLCNQLLKMDRLIVSDVPGTTRETVELDLDYESKDGEETWRFRLFDTVGLKRKNRIDSSLDYFSAVRNQACNRSSRCSFSRFGC